MSKNYEKIKAYYDEGAWSKEQVYNVVGKSTGITKEEYEMITGMPYDAEPFPTVITGDSYLLDFALHVSGTLHTVTSDEPINDTASGKIELNVPEEMQQEWAAGSLAKWEIFNDDTRIDAIPCFSFSINGQKAILCGFRTSGSSEKAFTKIKGALLLERRENT